jgi:hypothetical protein
MAVQTTASRTRFVLGEFPDWFHQMMVRQDYRVVNVALFFSTKLTALIPGTIPWFGCCRD